MTLGRGEEVTMGPSPLPCLTSVTLVFLLIFTVTDQAFVTLATNDIYCQGALVLGQSLRRHRLTRKLVVLITPQVSTAACAQLGPVEGGSPLPLEVPGVILMTDRLLHRPGWLAITMGL
ncbi:hypothetical protein P7K49_039805 [Saguinus oedipus]|uniref:Uncharacterized protein n=1 Tax=Saguinus oedipus TaxID=9490 RepID=A0ABQ9TC63_SAGOE|nr:hypothetical protein P7K49_039805 [Saguinus oedipus]